MLWTAICLYPVRGSGRRGSISRDPQSDSDPSVAPVSQRGVEDDGQDEGSGDRGLSWDSRRDWWVFTGDGGGLGGSEKQTVEEKSVSVDRGTNDRR